MSGKKIVLFVEYLPTVNKNTFFESELSFLAEKFNEVIVIPLYYDNAHIINETSVIKVVKFDYFTPVNRFKILIKNFKLILNIFLYEIFKSKHRIKYITNFIKNLNVLLIHIGNSENMYIRLRKIFNKEYLFYTYWFKQHTFSLLLLKEKYKFSELILSRVHGCDWDENRLDYFPFRYWQYSKIDRIIPITSYASDYIINNFNIESLKVVVSRLGIFQNQVLSPINSNVLNIVSCSGIIPLKQVSFIADIIKNIKIPVKWIHFGVGTEKAKVDGIISTFEPYQQGILKGHVSNKEFINFLTSDPVSLFINWSTSEGIPVSIMEAISAGIPVIAPNVGGMKEIVNEITGFLIVDLKTSARQLAEFISNKHLSGELYDSEKNKKIKKFASENFSDKANYRNFTDTISEINVSIKI